MSISGTTLNRVISLGCGNMGLPILRSITNNCIVKEVHILTRNKSSLHVHEEFGLSLVNTYSKVADIASFLSLQDANKSSSLDVLLIALKPQTFRELEQEIAILAKALPRNCIVISMMAGIEVSVIEGVFGSSFPIARCMPNILAKINQSNTGLYCNLKCKEGKIFHQTVHNILSCFGSVLELQSERLMHEFTALFGCGPRYLLLMLQVMMFEVQSLLTEGVEASDKSDIKGRAVDNSIGNSQFIEELLKMFSSTMHFVKDMKVEEIDSFASSIVSKNGVTAAALNVLCGKHGNEAGTLANLLKLAISAAIERSKELS